MGEGPHFSALPMRVIGDHRLSALHLRTLACVAAHDRLSLSGNGRPGCWAGNATLAREIGCGYTRLSATITELSKLGYIEKTTHPVNRRRRIYRVIYTSADRAAIGSDSFRDGKQSSVDSFPDRQESASIVSQQNSQVLDSNGEPVTNRLGEASVINSAKRGKNSPEGASISLPADDAVRLAMIERAWKRGQSFDDDEIEAIVAELERIEDESHVTDSNHGRAQRLLEDIRPEHWRPS